VVIGGSPGIGLETADVQDLSGDVRR